MMPAPQRSGFDARQATVRIGARQTVAARVDLARMSRGNDRLARCFFTDADSDQR